MFLLSSAITVTAIMYTIPLVMDYIKRAVVWCVYMYYRIRLNYMWTVRHNFLNSNYRSIVPLLDWVMSADEKWCKKHGTPGAILITRAELHWVGIDTMGSTSCGVFDITDTVKALIDTGLYTDTDGISHLPYDACIPLDVRSSETFEENRVYENTCISIHFTAFANQSRMRLATDCTETIYSGESNGHPVIEFPRRPIGFVPRHSLRRPFHKATLERTKSYPSLDVSEWLHDQIAHVSIVDILDDCHITRKAAICCAGKDALHEYHLVVV